VASNCAPRGTTWLGCCGGYAIKDAVRVRIAERGLTGVYPAEILVADDEAAVSGVHCESVPHGRVLAGLAVRRHTSAKSPWPWRAGTTNHLRKVGFVASWQRQSGETDEHSTLCHR